MRMRPFATATHVAWSLCVRVSQSAYLLATSASPAKTDEPIEMLFGYGTQEPLVDITQWTILGVFSVI